MLIAGYIIGLATVIVGIFYLRSVLKYKRLDSGPAWVLLLGTLIITTLNGMYVVPESVTGLYSVVTTIGALMVFTVTAYLIITRND